jgi:thymidylate synthase (FAD)
MKGELIERLKGDRGIVNAARVSFAADDSDYLGSKIPGLIKYLFRNRHWSPFAHCRLMFGLSLNPAAWLHFLENANLAGFTWAKNAFGHDVVLNGSLWAWYENFWFLPVPVQDVVFREIEDKYPIFARTCIDTLRQRVRANIFSGSAEVMSELPLNTATEYPQLHYACFRMTTPIFIARQLVKHQQGLTWNEESRRYITSDPELWRPDQEGWRHAPSEGVKQGSTDELVLYSDQDAWDEMQHQSLHHYKEMLAQFIAPEDARIGLPLNTRTSWIWTGHLLAWRRVIQERLHPHAQKYTRDVAGQMYTQLSEAYPGAWITLWGDREVQ